MYIGLDVNFRAIDGPEITEHIPSANKIFARHPIAEKASSQTLQNIIAAMLGGVWKWGMPPHLPLPYNCVITPSLVVSAAWRLL
jgi:hypothetical protein